MHLPKTDIHNHLLPGVDDGFRHSSDSLQAMEKMAGNGVKKFVFTPHMNPDVYPDMGEEDFRKVYAGFVSRIPAEWGVETALAAEYMCVNGFDRRVSEDSGSLLLHGQSSLLIEMSYYYRSDNLENAVFELNMAGITPILAHPERYLYMADCLSDFERLKDMGCQFQLNLMSLTGSYGPVSMRILEFLLKKGWYNFAATDLHTTGQLDKILDTKIDRHVRKLAEKLIINQ